MLSYPRDRSALSRGVVQRSGVCWVVHVLAGGAGRTRKIDAWHVKSSDSLNPNMTR